MSERYCLHADAVGGLASKLIAIAEDLEKDEKVSDLLLEKDQVLSFGQLLVREGHESVKPFIVSSSVQLFLTNRWQGRGNNTIREPFFKKWPWACGKLGLEWVVETTLGQPNTDSAGDETSGDNPVEHIIRPLGEYSFWTPSGLFMVRLFAHVIALAFFFSVVVNGPVDPAGDIPPFFEVVPLQACLGMITLTMWTLFIEGWYFSGGKYNSTFHIMDGVSCLMLVFVCVGARDLDGSAKSSEAFDARASVAAGMMFMSLLQFTLADPKLGPLLLIFQVIIVNFTKCAKTNVVGSIMVTW